MNSLVLLVLFINTFNALGKSQESNEVCKHTDIYNDHGYSNSNNYYFVPNTFHYGRSKSVEENNEHNHNEHKRNNENTFDICQSNSDDNQLFRNYIKSNILCVGQWCISDLMGPFGKRNNGWNCPKDSKRNCYEVEHIIPIENDIPELAWCDTNIFGNLIMAYGKWNGELSNGFLCEKKQIYGNEIYTKAYNSIVKCCSRKITYISGIIIAISILVIICSLIILYSYYKAHCYPESAKYSFEVL